MLVVYACLTILSIKKIDQRESYAMTFQKEKHPLSYPVKYSSLINVIKVIRSDNCLIFLLFMIMYSYKTNRLDNKINITNIIHRL